MPSLLSILALASSATALAIDKPILNKRSSNFKNIVAFGDELSDDGSGSFAHGITGNPASVYGFNTWTNGKVAVQYLADMLGTSLDSYAYGGCCGGGSFGATIDEDYTPSPAHAQSVKQQITNYTDAGAALAKESLGFVWIGENDLSVHTDAFWLDDPQNAAFVANISTKIAEQVQRLFDLGMPNVLVANIYPKHIAPVTSKYLCADSGCVDTWGQIITNANDAIKSSLAALPNGDKVIYYDSFAYISYVFGSAHLHGFTAKDTTTVFCDGDGDAIWDDCMVNGNGKKYMWQNYVQPTTQFHWYIAHSMKNTVAKYFA